MRKDSTEILILSEKNVRNLMKNKVKEGIEYVEQAFRERMYDTVLLPSKIAQIFNDKTQERINCMPATLLKQKVCGMKWVSVFPPNPKYGLRNVKGQIILTEINHGEPLAFLDGTWCTDFRTAAVGALASKYLAKRKCERIGFIGAGEQARMHFRLIKLVHPEIRECFVSSHTIEREKEFVEVLDKEYMDVKFVVCESNYERAVRKSDIIVTATSTQADLLKADWILPGALYIHVGGWEDEYKVVAKADKIVCDEWEAVKHRAQTLSRMYQEGLLKDQDVYADLAEIIVNRKQGRESEEEFIYFNSVGLAFVDIYLAYCVYELAKDKKIGLICEI